MKEKTVDDKSITSCIRTAFFLNNVLPIARKLIWSCALQICAVLYPGDATESGKLLRLKQQFFLCSASLQVGLNFRFFVWGLHPSSKLHLLPYLSCLRSYQSPQVLYCALTVVTLPYYFLIVGSISGHYF